VSVASTALPALDRARAAAIVAGFPAVRLVVVGDVMLDHFVIGRVSRISPEAPVPVVEFAREEYRPGGAANVAENVRALAAAVTLVGVVGDDRDAAHLRGELAARGLGSDGLVVDPGRRTTTKTRVVTTRNQQVARVDYESTADVPAVVAEALAARVAGAAAGAGAIVVSDYLKGAITPGLMARLVAIAGERRIPLLVDPKIPHLAAYAGATMVTPNHVEAELATHLRLRTDEDTRQAARLFRERAATGGVLITRGEHGMWLLDGDVEGGLEATAREVADVTGAGDTVIATFALALAAGATTAEAACLANEAAGIVVGKFGPATTSPGELLGRFA
jgi:rfaE bifunctional protein kinase chain/domain